MRPTRASRLLAVAAALTLVASALTLTHTSLPEAAAQGEPPAEPPAEAPAEPPTEPEPSTATEITPTITINVPQAFDAAGVNRFAGTRIGAQFRPDNTQPQPADCSGASPSIIRYYTVGDNGQVTGATPTLVRRPADGAIECAYEVNFLTGIAVDDVDGVAITLERQGARKRLLDNASPTIEVNYTARATIAATATEPQVITEGTFVPSVAIAVPQVNSPGTSTNKFSGVTIDLTFAQDAGSATGCSDPGTVTYMVDDDGDVAVDAPTLIRFAADGGDECTYTVTPAATAGSGDTSLWAVSSATRNVEWGLLSHVRYDDEAPRLPSFTPNVTISVPQSPEAFVDVDGTSSHRFQGRQFRVAYARAAGPQTGCTADDHVTFTVLPNGTIAGALPILIDHPPVGPPTAENPNPGLQPDHCVYEITFPTSPSNGTRLELTGTTTRTIHADAHDETATYVAPVEMFQPNVDIELPDPASDYAGVTFSVRFAWDAGPVEGCSSGDTVVYTVGADGSISPPTPMLIGYPVDNPAMCIYSVTAPLMAGSGATTLELFTSQRQTVQPAFPSERFAYARPGKAPTPGTTTAPVAGKFAPEVTITVLPGAEQHAYLGLTFDVTFSKFRGPDVGCSPDVTVTYEVLLGEFVYGKTVVGTDETQDALVALVGGDVVTHKAPWLVDVPPNQPGGATEPCLYTVSFPMTENEAPNDKLTLQPFGLDSQTWATSPAATATYMGAPPPPPPAPPQGAAIFTPDLTISVPTISAPAGGTITRFGGARFTVSFAPTDTSPEGCTAAGRVRYQVQSDGTVAGLRDEAQGISGTTPSLINIPANQPGGQTDRCTYTITFRFNEDGGTRLERDGAADREVTATDFEVTVNYTAPAQSFTPTVNFALPDPAATYAGLTFDVSFARVAGPVTGCSAPVARTYTVGTDGTVSGAAPSLTGYPRDDSAACVYRVAPSPRVGVGATALVLGRRITVPAAAGAGERTVLSLGPSSQSVQPLFPSRTFNYEVPGVGTQRPPQPPEGADAFTPTITINTPQSTAAFVGTGSVRTNRFVGRRFVVEFAPAATSPPNCTDAGSVTYTVQRDGTLDGATPQLLASPVAADGDCAYVVTFPSTESNGNRLALTGAAERNIDADNPAQSATYTAPERTFTPDVAIGLPPNAARYAGVTFDVTFERATGPDGVCSESQTVTYTVAADGTISAAAPTLVGLGVDNPAECTYVVTPPTRTDCGRFASPAERQTCRAEQRPADAPGYGGTALAINPPLFAFVELAATARSFSYRALGASSFVPDVTIRVLRGAASDAYLDATFDVTFRRASGPATGCSPDITVTYRVGPRELVYGETVVGTTDVHEQLIERLGGATLTDKTPRLVDQPAGQNASCTYEVTYPLSEQGGTELSILADDPAAESTQIIAAQSPATANTYAGAQAPSTFSFTPDITIEVPQITGGPRSLNVFVGKRFTVTFTKLSGPESCSRDVNATFSVQPDGTMFGTAPVLIDHAVKTPTKADPTTQEATPCVYEVTFPATESNGSRLALSGAAQRQVDADNPAQTATYTAPRQTFQPSIDIEIPTPRAPHVGLTFDVTFVRTGGPTTGCDGDAVTYSVAADGSIAGVTPTLTGHPANSAVGCIYQVTLPEEVGADDAALELFGEPTRAVQQSSHGRTFSYYRPGEAPAPPPVELAGRFTPDVRFGVTPGTTANAYLNDTFVVTFIATETSSASCSPDVTATYKVGNNNFVYGERVTVGANTYVVGDDVSDTVEVLEVTSLLVASAEQTALVPQLIDTPVGETARCVYAVTFPDNEDGATSDLTRQTEEVVEISGERRIAGVIYSGAAAASRLSFTPTVAIEVTPLSVLRVTGLTQFTVTFAPVAGGPSGCSDSVERTFTVLRDGSLDGQPPTLVNTPLGQPANNVRSCAYTATFPLSENDGTTLALADAASRETQTFDIDGAALAATYAFTSPETTFTPAVLVGISGGGEAYAGVTFDVAFSRTAGPSTGCSDDVTVPYTVGADGTVVGGAPSLVATPANNLSACIYSVVVPTSAGTGETELVVDGPTTRAVQHSSRLESVTARFTYRPPNTFTPSVRLTVARDATPEAYAGLSFDVVFAKRPSVGPVSGCSPDVTVTYVVEPGSSGSRVLATSVVGTTDLEVRTVVVGGDIDPDTGLVVVGEGVSVEEIAPRLIDVPFNQPGGATDACAYDVRYPTHETDGTRLTRKFQSGLVVSAASPATSARYASTVEVFLNAFVPEVNIAVPQVFETVTVGGLTERVNRFVGRRFAVTFASDGDLAGCTNPARPVVYTIQADGTVLGTTPRLTDEPAGQPAGQEGVTPQACTYTLTFADHEAGGDRLDLAASGIDATIDADNPVATATYAAPERRFTPTVRITGPTAAHASLTFDVGFTQSGGPRGACSATESVTYTVGANGTVTGATPSLISFPADHPAQCIYSVSVPLAVGAGATALAPDGPSRRAVMAGSAAVAFAYVEPAVTAPPDQAVPSFAPTVDIDVPQRASSGGATLPNLFTGTRFRVSFARASGPLEGCSRATALYTVRADGTVTGAAPRLVDVPATEAAAATAQMRPAQFCVYEVAFADADASSGRLVRQSVATKQVTLFRDAAVPDSETATAVYRAPEIPLAPDVDVALVPATASDGTPEPLDRTAYAGVTFGVLIAQSGLATDGCSDPIRVPYEVADDGTISGEVPELVRYPADRPDECFYELLADEFAGSGDAALGLIGSRRYSMSGRNPSVTFSYRPVERVAAPGVAVDTEGQVLSFRPSVTVQVPTRIDLRPVPVAAGQPPLPDRAVNLFTGQTFDVAFRHKAGTGPANGCTTDAPSVTYTVADDGTTSGGEMPRLTDRPPGAATSCEYEIVLPSLGSAAGADVGWTLSDAAASPVVTQLSEPTRTVAYAAGPVTFRFELDAAVPWRPGVDDPATRSVDESTHSAFAGASLQISFARVGTDPRCAAPLPETYLVQRDAGRPGRPDGALDVLPADGVAPRLVAYPPGEAASCAYEATMPRQLDVSSASGTVVTHLATDTTFPVTVNLNRRSPAIIFRPNTFRSDVGVTLPDYVTAPGPNAPNVFLGATLSVPIARVAGPAGECGGEGTVTFTVLGNERAADGKIALVANEQRELTDVPVGQTASCEYAATFAPTISSAAGADPAWTLALVDAATGGAVGGAPGGWTTGVLTEQSPSVERAYAIERVTFTLAVRIEVPSLEAADGTNLFAGETFDVEFRHRSGTGAGGDCSTDVPAVTYTVADDGEVSGVSPTLIDRTAGATSSCEYDVVLPDGLTSDAGAPMAWKLTRSDDATLVVHLQTRLASTFYASVFEPRVFVVVPFVDGDEDGRNDAAGSGGRTVTVNYRPVAVPEQGPGCTQSASETYTLGVGKNVAGAGEVTLTSEPAQLVDRLPAYRQPCRYVADFDDAFSPEEGFGDVPIASGDLSEFAVGQTIQVTYDAPPPLSPPEPAEPTTPPVVNTPPVNTGSTGRSPGPSVSRGGSSRGGTSRPADRDDEPDEPTPAGPVTVDPAMAADEFAGFVAVAERAPVKVVVALPQRAFAVTDTMEIWVSSPSACGFDVSTFGGVPALVGLVYGVSARSGAAVDVIGEGDFQLPTAAQRGSDRRPCALRVTLLSAPAGCSLAGAQTDSAGRSYVELAWSDDTAIFDLAPSFTCTDPSPPSS